MTTPIPTRRDNKPGRLQWIDSARGACVLAVVLFHVCLWHYLPLSGSAWQPAASGWNTVNGYLGSLRMPVLLALSGMLAARRIGEGWERPEAAVRAASTYYLYVVWLGVYFALYIALSGVPLPHRIAGIDDFARQFLVPETPLWYVFALALYVTVLTSTRRLPPWIVLAILAVLAVVVLVANPNWPMFEKVPENAIYFAIGVYAGPRLQTFAARRSRADLLVWLVVGFASILVAKWSFGHLIDAVLHVGRGVVFIVLGVAVVVTLIRWRPLATFGEFIGRRTLQIYVLHAPLIMVVLALVNNRQDRWLTSMLRVPALSIAWPFIVMAVVVGSSLLIYRLLILSRLGFLFQMPGAVSTLVYRTHTRLARRRRTTSDDEPHGGDVSTLSPAG